jgi:hypothetical protein
MSEVYLNLVCEHTHLNSNFDISFLTEIRITKFLRIGLAFKFELIQNLFRAKTNTCGRNRKHGNAVMA